MSEDMNKELDTEVVYQDQAELNRIHAKGLNHRKKQGSEDQDSRS